MATTSQPAVSFDDADSRYDEMHSQLKAWAEELIDLVDEAVASEEFQEWFAVQCH